MNERIAEELRRIEQEEKVCILYACESGSRAWGFASVNSDYDVRFIYMHSPEWYLSIGEKRDVLEYPISESLDINGWDIRKALRLAAKSNQGLIEWLNSPIVYTEKYNARERLIEAVKGCFSPRGCIHHYLSSAAQNYRDYLQGETVRTKKYLYVVRPLLACRWLEKNQTIPPIEFDRLLEGRGLEGELLDELRRLVERKRNGDRLGLEPRVDAINSFIDSELEYYREYVKGLGDRELPDTMPLDRIFIELMQEVWGLRL